MDLQRLKWTKNVKPSDKPWAYEEFKVGKLFKLTWKDDETNAGKPQKNDLILLRQNGYVTHLVGVLDDNPGHETGGGDYSIYRIVETLWAEDCTNPSQSAKAEVVFDYPVNYRGGDVMELETLPTFKQRWDNDNGLQGFQSHVQGLLALSSSG